MRVIVKIEYQQGEIITKFLDLAVRKCPPNYKPKESEWMIELDDYSEEDIKEYFSKEDLTAWQEEHGTEEQFISLMHYEE